MERQKIEGYNLTTMLYNMNRYYHASIWQLRILSHEGGVLWGSQPRLFWQAADILSISTEGLSSYHVFVLCIAQTVPVATQESKLNIK